MKLSAVCLFIACLSASLAHVMPLGRVGEFRLRDVRGVEQTEKTCRGSTATVLVFLGTECPVSNGYAPELTRIAKEYAPRGVSLVGVHGDPDVTPQIAARHAREYGLTFSILMDPAQTLARATGVETMPEVAVLLPDGDVVYRGRIDDKYTETGKRRAEPTRRDLRIAIDTVLAGKRPEPSVTKAFGCPLPKIAK